MTFYTGKEFPPWHGNLFLGGLSGRVLVRLELDGMEVVHEERLLKDLGERIRDVRQGPDGHLYLLTDASNGALLRLDPIQTSLDLAKQNVAAQSPSVASGQAVTGHDILYGQGFSALARKPLPGRAVRPGARTP